MIKTPITFEEIPAELEARILSNGSTIPPFMFDCNNFLCMRPITTLKDMQLLFFQLVSTDTAIPPEQIIEEVLNTGAAVIQGEQRKPIYFGFYPYCNGIKLSDYLAEAGVNVDALATLPYNRTDVRRGPPERWDLPFEPS